MGVFQERKPSRRLENNAKRLIPTRRNTQKEVGGVWRRRGVGGGGGDRNEKTD